MAARPLRTGIGACVVSQIDSRWARASHCATTPRFSIAAAVPRSYQSRRRSTRSAAAFAAA